MVTAMSEQRTSDERVLGTETDGPVTVKAEDKMDGVYRPAEDEVVEISPAVYDVPPGMDPEIAEALNSGPRMGVPRSAGFVGGGIVQPTSKQQQASDECICLAWEDTGGNRNLDILEGCPKHDKMRLKQHEGRIYTPEPVTSNPPCAWLLEWTTDDGRRDQQVFNTWEGARFAESRVAVRDSVITPLVRAADVAGEARSHPWGDFLSVRAKAIDWLHAEGNSDTGIAETLSMDERQVQLIRTRDRS